MTGHGTTADRRNALAIKQGNNPDFATGYAGPVITAIVFIQADVSRISSIAEQIADIDGVSEVYSVTGDLDLLAMVRVREVDDVAKVVADQLNKVDGVLSTQTQIAFQTFSQHDLESAFSIGL